MSTADSAELEPNQRTMTCPTCVTSAPWLRNPHRPFCSLAGRLLDLGVWFDQGCRVPFDERGDVP